MADPPLPVPRHGFNMEVPTGEMPAPIRDVANPPATADPQTSLLVVQIRPDRRDRVRYFQTFCLAEEMMHGRRHSFGLSRSDYLLKRGAHAALFGFALDDRPLAEAAAEIVTNEAVCTRLHGKREPFLESVDRYLCQSIMGEAGYLDQHVEKYCEAFPEADQADVRADFEQVRAGLEAVIPEAGVRDHLAGLEARYGRQVAETVSDAALDIPYLVALEAEDMQTVHVGDLDLEGRFDAAVAALERLPADVGELDRRTLRRRLERELDDPLETDEAVAHPRDLSLPLLDLPQSLDPDRAVRDKYEVILDSPTGIGGIVNAAFRFTGNFGGVVYRTETPEGEIRPDRLVNPMIADRDLPADAGYDPVPARTYAELWEWTYVGERLVQQLVRQIGAPELRSVRCPLCLVSTDGVCHGDGCRCRGVVAAINDRIEDVVAALEAEHAAQSGAGS